MVDVQPTAGPDLPTRRQLLASALHRPGLRRVGVVFTCFRAAEIGSWIAIIAVAHSFGGVDESSRALVVQLAPSAVFALLVHRIAAVVGPKTVLVAGLAVQCVGFLAVAAAVAADGPHWTVYAPAIVAAVAVVTTRPTLAALLPQIVSDPHELTAANSLVGTLDGAASLAGPVLAGVGLAIGPSTPFLVFAGTAAVATVVGHRLAIGTAAVEVAPPVPPPDRPEPDEPAPSSAERDQRRGIRALLVVIALQGLLVGSLDLIFVVIAVDLTHGPPERTAWLSAAFGVGALVGGVASTWMVGRRHLWPVVVGAGAVASLMVALLSATTSVVAAAGAILVCGAACTGLLVGARSLLQRVCDLASLCRAFSVAEASEMAMLLAGALLVPVLVDRVGARTTPLGVALVVVAALALVVRPMARAEQQTTLPVVALAVLRRVGLFAHVPGPAIETLAREARTCTVKARTVLIREGEAGDEFFAVVSGRVTVTIEGAFVRQIGPDDGFGELALLYDTPRTATVTADVDTTLLVIERTPFLVAMTGQAVTATYAPAD